MISEWTAVGRCHRRQDLSILLVLFSQERSALLVLFEPRLAHRLEVAQGVPPVLQRMV